MQAIEKFLSLVCHRMPERSFHAGEFQALFCARCSGLYLGFLIGFSAMLCMRDPHAAWRKWAIPAAFAVVIPVLDVYLAMKGIYGGNNAVRYLTGLAAGLGIGMLVSVPFLASTGAAVQETRNRGVLAAARVLLAVSTAVATAPLFPHRAILTAASILALAGLLACTAMLTHIVLARLSKALKAQASPAFVLAVSIAAAPGLILLVAAASGKMSRLL